MKALVLGQNIQESATGILFPLKWSFTVLQGVLQFYKLYYSWTDGVLRRMVWCFQSLDVCLPDLEDSFSFYEVNNLCWPLFHAVTFPDFASFMFEVLCPQYAVCLNQQTLLQSQSLISLEMSLWFHTGKYVINIAAWETLDR